MQSTDIPKIIMKNVSVVVVYGGELAQDVAEQIESLKPDCVGNNDIDINIVLKCASERPKNLLQPLKLTSAATAATENENGGNNDTVVVVCFVIQTIENGSPTDEGGTTIRFFKRKTHPTDLLSSSDSSSTGGGKVSWDYAVLGLGDSNLLLDRQTTTAKDCNQAAQQLDTRLHSLGTYSI